MGRDRERLRWVDVNEKFLVNNGKQFDFGKASEKYAKYRDIYSGGTFSEVT